jgi:hypothetical protein
MPQQYSSTSDPNARWREFDAGLLHAAGDREAAQSPALAPAMRAEPTGALLDDVAHPVERLDVLLQRRPAEQADLRHVRRAVARQAAFAFDRFDHRRFFAADISAGAAPQMQLRMLTEAGLLDLGDLVGQHQRTSGYSSRM